MTRVLLTGAKGFVGQALLTALEPSTGLEVIGTDLPELDVTNRTAVLEQVSALRPDVVLHGAGITTGTDVRLLEVNLRGTLHLLEAANLVQARHFVFFSSSGVYTPNGLPVDENAPTSSGSAYALSKLLGEELCRVMQHQLTMWVLRLGAVYAAGEVASATRANTSWMAQIAAATQSQNVLLLPRAPEDVYNWLHASDFAALLEKICQRSPDGLWCLYNVGGESVTVARLLETFAAVAGREVAVQWATPTPRHGELVCSRVQQELGWQPRVRLEDGVKGYLGGFA
jgi:nucleoside-diphosphate-sugar epimerase